jgi:hypothetical protein
LEAFLTIERKNDIFMSNKFQKTLNRNKDFMDDDLSKIEDKINLLKQRKERIKTQKAILLLKEAQGILSDNFSYELVLSILKNSWDSASEKQKEEWVKSANQFRKDGGKRSSKGMAASQKEVSHNTTENP